MQVSPIPSGPTYYQPVTAVPAVAPVKGRPSDDGSSDVKVRAAPPPGLGSLLDIEA